MENASKALLIAAAILIVIILIAFGMKILGSSGNTAEQAEKVGQSITSESVIATEKALEALKGTDKFAAAGTTETPEISGGTETPQQPGISATPTRPETPNTPTTPETPNTPTAPNNSETITFKIQSWNYGTFEEEKVFTVKKGTTWKEFGEANNAIAETLNSINPNKIGMGGEYLATAKESFYLDNNINLNSIISEEIYYTAVIVP